MRTAFSDREQAGRLLAERVAAVPRPGQVVVLALPRGGVPIGVEVARALGAPLDLLLVRKIGAPWQRELAVGAVVDGIPPVVVVDDELCARAGVVPDYIEDQAREELREIERRRRVYLGQRKPLPLGGATVIVVDDGLATGTTMRAALRAIRKARPAHVVLAVPVAPADTLEALRAEVDEVVCLATPSPFNAVGEHYVDFHQVGDDEVVRAMDFADLRSPDAPVAGAPPAG